MPKALSAISNEDGYLMVATIMILVLLTIIGISATRTSKTEVQTSTNSLLYERAFYTAESGMEHIIELLKVPYITQNEVNLASGAPASWTFALVGATDSVGSDGIGDFAGGVPIINATLDGVSYTVTIWNDGDGGSPTNDTNGLIFVRSVAVGPRGAVCQIETLLDGNSVAMAITGYAQVGAGSDKSFISDDAEAIDFSALNFGPQI